MDDGRKALMSDVCACRALTFRAEAASMKRPRGRGPHSAIETGRSSRPISIDLEISSDDLSTEGRTSPAREGSRRRYEPKLCTSPVRAGDR
jgi:hypothetical protein